MRYLLKQELFAWGDDFSIFDEAGNKVYFVDGHGIAIANKLSFQDLERRELAFIQQIIFTWGREYTISFKGKVFAKVSQQRLHRTKCKFFIDVPGPDDLEAEGDFYNHNYVFRRGKNVAATVSKEGLREGFGVDVVNIDDAVLLLASSIVIELISHDDANRGFLYK